MRFLLHLVVRSEMSFGFKRNNFFKVELLKKCIVLFCIFNSRENTRSHTAVKRLCPESSQVSSELSSPVMSTKKDMPELLLFPCIEGYVEGRGRNFDIKQLFMEQLHQCLSLGPHFHWNCQIALCPKYSQG